MLKFTSQLLSTADEPLNDETRLLLLGDGSLLNCTHCVHTYTIVVKPVDDFMARKVSKNCLMAELCFHRFVHFDCVPIYIYIYIYIHTHIYVYILTLYAFQKMSYIYIKLKDIHKIVIFRLFTNLLRTNLNKKCKSMYVIRTVRTR